MRLVDIDRTQDLIFCGKCGKFSKNVFEFFDIRFAKPRNNIERQMSNVRAQCPHCMSNRLFNASQLLTTGANKQMQGIALSHWIHLNIYKLVLHALWDQKLRLK